MSTAVPVPMITIGNATIHQGDCVELLSSWEPEQFDSCCTDAPYHLQSIVNRFGKEGAAPAKGGVYARCSGGFMGKAWDGGDIAFRADTWRAVYHVLKPGAYLAAFASARGYHRMTCAIEDAGFTIHPMLGWIRGDGMPKAHRIKAAGYEGQRYGAQALKPALEPICLAQKPFSERTGTANILRWGTGALNIDMCRTPADGGKVKFTRHPRREQKGDLQYRFGSSGGQYISDEGRWPANVLHDGSDAVLESFARFGEVGGQGAVTGNEPSRAVRDDAEIFNSRCRAPAVFHGGVDSPARFFADCPFADEDVFFYAPAASAADRLGFRHPTIKPISLMRWLVRLITPAGGCVLDPFAGTFTTGQAALMENRRAVGVELETESFDACCTRIRHMSGGDLPLLGDRPKEPVRQARMF